MAENTKPYGILANRPFIVDVLFLATVLTGGTTSILGGLLAYIFQAGHHEEWEASHFVYQIRTFWLFVISIILIVAIVIVYVAGYQWAGFFGIPVFGLMILTGIRSILSLINAVKELAMPRPRSWLY